MNHIKISRLIDKQIKILWKEKLMMVYEKIYNIKLFFVSDQAR